VSESAPQLAARVSLETPGPDVSRETRNWPAAARLIWLHLRSRRVPAALVALLACGVTL
jgi:hypothetical protein